MTGVQRPRTERLDVGRLRFRVVPWAADPAVAYLRVGRAGMGVTVDGIREAVRRLDDLGFTAAITPALHPTELAAWIAAGFTEHERLVVLGRHLENPPPLEVPDGYRVRRAARRAQAALLEVDARAFAPAWRMDRHGLEEALAATPAVRHRMVVAPDRRPAGYAVCGRAGQVGYLQRLAIDPDHQRHGLGRVLVVDAMRWLAGRGVRQVLVNTQEDNTAALALYHRLGFAEVPTSLVVLSRGIR